MFDGEDGVLFGVRLVFVGLVMMLFFSEVGVGILFLLVLLSQVLVLLLECWVGVGLLGVFVLFFVMMVIEGFVDVLSGLVLLSVGVEFGMDLYILKLDMRSGSERLKLLLVIFVWMYVGGEFVYCLCRVRWWCQGVVYCDLLCDNSGIIRNFGWDLKVGCFQFVVISWFEFCYEWKEVGVVEDNGGYVLFIVCVEKFRICLVSKGVSYGQCFY